MKTIIYYFRIWWLMSRNSFVTILYSKVNLSIFLTGKILRFIFFISFLYFLLRDTNSLAGYSLNQTIFFFLTFNLVDVLAQFLYREVYRFRPLIVSGDFDLVLAKPLSALFRVLMGGADLIDFITIPPLLIAIYFSGMQFNPTIIDSVTYVLLVANGILIATSFHILVLSLGIVTYSVDHMIMVYRDVVSLGKFPVNIYKEPLKSIITYFVPVGIMITLPAQSLMKLASPQGIFLAFALGALSLLFSTRMWKFALKKYTSASS